jgi:fructokinase
MRIGIDLGGTKIEIIALDDDGKVLLRRRVATPQGDYARTLEAIIALVVSAESELGRVGSVGIGAPGAVSSTTGNVRNANSVVLNDKPLAADLCMRLKRKVRIANDANCLVLSEAVDGSGADGNVVFAVIIGTGTGGGIAVEKRILVGRNDIGGEWGHNPLPWPRDDERPGAACYCGRFGCIETFLSGPGMASHFAAQTGRSLNSRQIVEAVEADDVQASAYFFRYVDRLARSLAHVVNIIDPDVIVLGGGMSNIDRIYPLLPDLIKHYILGDVFDTPIRKALHGDSSGVRGAAWLACDA